MKPLPNSLEYSVEGSALIASSNSAANYTKDISVSWRSQNDIQELLAEFDISGYPPHVANILTQTVTHEEIRIYSGATLETVGSGSYCSDNERPGKHLLIRSTKRNNIERAVTWIKRLIEQAMNLPKYKEKVLIGLENASPGFDVRGKVLGPGGANLQYITNETGAIVTLRGRGSGFIEPTTGLESIEPLHLCVEHNSKYEVLQAGRQLAFNLIETVQQEWYTYQQQHQHTAASSLPAQQQQQQPANQSLQNHQQVANPVMQHAPAQHLHIPPPTHPGPPIQGQPNQGQVVPSSVTTAVPPPLTAVPPPLIHQPPPGALQLTTDLSQLVQAPPPHLTQPPPHLVQQAQLVQQPQTTQSQQLVHSGQPQQLVQQQPGQTQQMMQHGQPQSTQAQQLVQSGQLVQAPQPQLVQQPSSLSLVQQNQPSILQTQQALSQGMLVPPGVGPGQTVQVVQTSQLSAAIQPSPQPGLQEIPQTHVYSTGAGTSTAAQVANLLAQQVIPAGTSIIQQPHIISQASYPQIQYMQTGAGSMAVLYGAASNAANSREGVMLVQYAGSAAGTRRLQPQIVQLVHPGTGQVMGSAPLLLQGPSSPLVLQQPAPAPPQASLLPPPVSGATVLLQQPAAPQHQLHFAAQPQPIHILPPPHQTMVAVSSGGQVVTSAAQSSTVVTTSQHGLVSVSPQGHITPAHGQKRRLDTDNILVQAAPGNCISVSEISSQHKKGVGEASPSKIVRDQSTPSPSIHSKLILTSAQPDEQDLVQVSRVEMKPDCAKRGRTANTHVDESDGSKETKTVYSFAGSKVSYTQPPPQHATLPQSQHAVLHQGQQAILQQGQHSVLQPSLVTPQIAPALPPPPQFTAPPPHYPPQYYHQPSYQTYQPSWNHMHTNNNQ